MFDSADMITDFSNRIKKEVLDLYKKDKTSVVPVYLQRLPMMVMKLDGLHAISYNDTILNKGNTDILLVQKRDVEWAIERVEKHRKHFENMMLDWAEMNVTQAPVISDKNELDHIRTCVNTVFLSGANPGVKKIISQMNQAYTPKRKEHVIGCLDTLVSQGKLKETSYKYNGRTFKGWKPI